jgi:hypothetical protein
MENDKQYAEIVSFLSDTELLKSIETPDDINKESYHAILTESLNRKLISQEQFIDLFDIKNNFEREKFNNKEDIDVVQVNIKDYWKCATCGQVIEMNFDTCWNCQSIKPEKIEYPSANEVIKNQAEEVNEVILVNSKYDWKCPKCGEIIEENFDSCWNCQNNIPPEMKPPVVGDDIKYQITKKPFNFMTSGFKLIGIGIFFFVFSGICTFLKMQYYSTESFVLGCFSAAFGIIFIIIGFTQKSS